jgi:hypothetical protein
VESVDTTDLKSVAFWACQFESGSGHHTSCKKMTKKSLKTFEQLEFFARPKSSEPKSPPPPPFKKPFIPIQTQALDRADIQQNFMPMIRFLLSTHQRSLTTPIGQDLFIETLLNEIKIKRGLLPPELAIRASVLKSFKK